MAEALPPELIGNAELRGGEYGWRPEAFPEALRQAESLGYACLGGQFQFRLADGSIYELYWIDAHAARRKLGESWREYVRRSCGEVLEGFHGRLRGTDFRKEAREWQELDAAMRQGFDLCSALVFVAEFVAEAELLLLRTPANGQVN